jgi:hypothetical protein
MHVPSQILYAVEKETPTILLVRAPVDAVTSLLVRNQGLSSYAVLQGYIDYHTAVCDAAEYCVVGKFGEVTTMYRRVLERVNHRYETEFEIFEHTPSAEEEVFERIKYVSQNVDPVGLKRIAKPNMRKGVKKK